MKKLNWGAFVFIMILTGLGLASNKHTTDLTSWFIGWLIFGIPIALVFVYMGKED